MMKFKNAFINQHVKGEGKNKMSKIKYVAFFIIGILSLCKGNRNPLTEEWIASVQAKEDLYEGFPAIISGGCSACAFGSVPPELELT